MENQKAITLIVSEQRISQTLMLDSRDVQDT